jgi:hypothetical protein
MGTALVILIYALSGAAALAVNYVLWFILIPMSFRQLRDQFRRIRARRISK